MADGAQAPAVARPPAGAVYKSPVGVTQARVIIRFGIVTDANQTPTVDRDSRAR